MSFVSGRAYRVCYHLVGSSPKEKNIICVSDVDKYLVFFIVSEPRLHQPEGSQIRISPSELFFLSFDSFVDTAEITICNPITWKVVADYGKIPNVLRDKICTAVSTSETLALRYIDNILKSLSK